MIQEVNRACEKLNRALGLSVSLPSPGKRELRAAAVCSLAAGTALAAVGAILSSRWCVVLGGAGIASGVVLRKEGNAKEN